jgi:hypothetical protein
MNEILIISSIWMGLGALVMYWVDKRAYNEGLMDAIIMHNKGQLTYAVYENENGDRMIEMEVRPDES